MSAEGVLHGVGLCPSGEWGWLVFWGLRVEG